MTYQEDANGNVRSPITICKLGLDQSIFLNPFASGVIRTVFDLAATESGDSIIISDPTHDFINVSNYHFSPRITIRSAVRTLISRDVVNTGACIKFTNCSGFTLEGFETVGSLYGIELIDCYDFTIFNNLVHGCGQEAIAAKIFTNTILDNIQIKGNRVYSTGLANAQYGEAIYVGNGSNPLLGEIKNVVVTNNEIWNTTAEAIDIKDNVTSAKINDNKIYDCVLKFNGAISVAEAAVTGKKQANYEILRNDIANITNDNGQLANFIIVGGGNCNIGYNKLTTPAAPFMVGIRTTKNATNTTTNNVYVHNNIITGFDEAQEIRANFGGTMNAPCNVFLNQPVVQENPDLGGFLISDLSPALWLDASDLTTITTGADGTSVTQWNDKSGNARHAVEGAAGTGVQSGYTINGLNAMNTENGDSMTLPGFTAKYCVAVISFTLLSNSNNVLLGTNTDFTSELIYRSRETGRIGFNGSGTATGRFSVKGGAFSAYATSFIGCGFVAETIVCTSEFLTNFTLDRLFSRTAGGGSDKGARVCEIVWFTEALTAGNKAEIEAHLATKWGVTLV